MLIFKDDLLQRLFYNRIKSEFFNLTATFVRVVRLKVEAGKVKPNTVLTPLLSQLHVNVNDFCTQCNLLTVNFSIGFPVQIDLVLYPDRVFKIFVKAMPISVLIKNYTVDDESTISLILNKKIELGLKKKINYFFISFLNLYKIFCILTLNYQIKNLMLVRSFFGTLRSFNFLKIVKQIDMV